MSNYGLPYLLLFVIITLIGIGFSFLFKGPVPYLIIGFGITFTLFIFCFFRDTKRKIPKEPNIIVSPADGKILGISRILNDEYVGDCNKVSIFMNIFNVHIIRMPLSAIVKDVRTYWGKYRFGFTDVASNTNTRISIHLDSPKGKMKLHLIAGAIARKIICKVEQDEKWEIGEKIGMIKFGSRVDFFIPLNVELNIQPQMKVKGGETILGKWKE